MKIRNYWLKHILTECLNYNISLSSIGNKVIRKVYLIVILNNFSDRNVQHMYECNAFVRAQKCNWKFSIVSFSNSCLDSLFPNNTHIQNNTHINAK